MSYDKIWIEHKEYPGRWLERWEAEKKNLSDEFYTNHYRLRAQGNFVVLSAGKNCSFDDSELADDVQFNDPKLMNPSPMLWSADDCIQNCLSGYPYVGFRWLCRRLGLTPAETLKRITPYITEIENCCWTPSQVTENLIIEVDDLIEKGWEPGVRPTEPPNSEVLYQTVWDHFKPEFRMFMDESIADLVYRSGSDTQSVVKTMVEVAVACTLRRFKYLSLDPSGDECKWLLSPVELAEAAANCEWIRGAREEAAKEKEGK